MAVTSRYVHVQLQFSKPDQNFSVAIQRRDSFYSIGVKKEFLVKFPADTLIDCDR